MLASTLFPLSLIAATLLCGLVAGLLFAFAIVTMPGIKSLDDGEFIRAFQVMDGVIQNNQPIFIFVWVGSALLLLAATVLGLGQLDLMGRGLLLMAALLYILGVQLPTITINVPLNNRLQAVDLGSLDVAAQATTRLDFEPRWNRWNQIRTAMAILVTSLLIVLLFLL